MTPSILDALGKVQSLQDEEKPRDHEEPSTKFTSEPSLLEPEVGKPISHTQIISLSKQLRASSLTPYHLDILLCSSKPYIPPPPMKPEPTPEYKALMARLRRNEEERVYATMTSPSSTSNQSPHTNEEDPDEMTYSDASRQVTLIFNVLISVVACGAAIWIAARWWRTPARLALSMFGALLVGVAEVAVYGGYLRRLGEAREKEKGVKEVREIIGSWSVGGGKVYSGDGVDLAGAAKETDGMANGARERKVKKSEDKT